MSSSGLSRNAVASVPTPPQTIYVNGRQNGILARLDHSEHRRLSRYLEPFSLRFGQTLYEPHEEIGHVYFPESGVISLVVVLEQGGVIETGIVGNEGMAGLAVFLGMPSTHWRAVCQVPSEGLRLESAVLRRERRRGGPFNDLLLRYTHAVVTMVSHSAACNRAHSVEERLSRWLLMTHDRIEGDEMALTQQFLAMMLGVHRPSVNVAGAALQNAGLIKYTRGRITVTDRLGLERTTCECYRKINEEFARAMAV
jgi:CRP-like cAMP-binding protein